MGRRQHRDAVIRGFLQEAREFICGLRIEAGRRLVEQQRLRVLGEGDGDADLLAHAFRIMRDPSVGGGRIESGLVQELEQARASEPPTGGERDEIVEVFDPGERRIERYLLGNIGDIFLRFELALRRLRGR